MARLAEKVDINECNNISFALMFENQALFSSHFQGNLCQNVVTFVLFFTPLINSYSCQGLKYSFPGRFIVNLSPIPDN